jgi:uncharacterized phage protein gp47/JayE
MPSLPTQSFATMVANTIVGIQGRAAKLINFSTGSSLRAITEGFAGLFLWFQAMVLQLLTACRLSTASGNDVDTFCADFMPSLPNTSSPRLGPQASSGQVTLSRFTAGPNSCFILADGSVTFTTLDGSQIFQVTADPAYTTYSSILNGYTLPSSVASIVVPVLNTVPGGAGNVAEGSIIVMTSPITGIDQVFNNAAFTNGFDQESDPSLKARFAAYILGLSRGDKYGLTAAIEGVEVEIQWTLTEGYNLDGSYRPGYFFVVADDGSGTPSPSFLTTVTNAANAVRPLGIQFSVFTPTVILATVSMQLTTAQGYDHNTVVAQVAAAIATNIDSLGLGNDLEWSILASWAYAIPGVTKVTNVILNGLTGDAASISASRLTQDDAFEIGCYTIKCRTAAIS